jgi:hypothetical protein
MTIAKNRNGFLDKKNKMVSTKGGRALAKERRKFISQAF